VRAGGVEGGVRKGVKGKAPEWELRAGRRGGGGSVRVLAVDWETAASSRPRLTLASLPLPLCASASHLASADFSHSGLNVSPLGGRGAAMSYARRL
jgi:hypothetical protein